MEKLSPYRSVLFNNVCYLRLIPLYLSLSLGLTLPKLSNFIQDRCKIRSLLLMTLNICGAIVVEQTKTATSRFWWGSLVVDLLVVFTIVPIDHHMKAFVWLPFSDNIDIMTQAFYTALITFFVDVFSFGVIYFFRS